MTITVAGGALLPVVSTAAEPVNARSTVPMLSCVRLKGGNGQLRILGTDLHVWVEACCSATGALETTCLAADHLLAIAKAAGASPVCLTTHADKVRARYDGGQATMPLVPAHEFPEPRSIEGGPTLALPAGALPAAVARVAPCVLKEQAKFCLGGARLRVGPEGASLCATDNHRLSKVALPGVAESRWPDVIAPGPALELFGEMAGAVTLRLGEGLIRAESAGLTVTARLLAGAFPDIERLIPAAATPLFGCATAALKAAVKRVLWAVGANAAPVVGLKLAPGSPGLVWATHGATTAEATFACDATRPFEAGFVGRYILDLCRYISTAQLTLHQATPVAPALVVGMPGDVLIVMPCRIPPYPATVERSDA